MPAGRELSTRTDGRRPKAPQEGTRGGWWAVCRLWGFGGSAAWVGGALAGVVGVGPTIGVAIWSLRRRSSGGVWLDCRRCRRLGGRWGNGDTTAGARVRGGAGVG